MGFPYSRGWAANVFRHFGFSYPRSGNLIAVFQQILEENANPWGPEDIRDLLIEAIRTTKGQKLWEEFKKCAKYPKKWNKDKTKALALEIGEQLYARYVESKQLLFPEGW